MRNLDWKDFLRREGGSILTILCGVILVLKPDTASALLAAVAGWALIAVGVAALIAGFAGGFGTGSVVTGAVLLLAGAWLHRNPLMIASVLGARFQTLKTPGNLNNDIGEFTFTTRVFLKYLSVLNCRTDSLFVVNLRCTLVNLYAKLSS